MEDWESFDGMCALKGVDPRDWTLRRMLNAVEHQILNSASDEKELAKIRSKLYTPPRPPRKSGEQPAPPTPRKRPQRAAQGQQTTAELMAMLAAQGDGG